MSTTVRKQAPRPARPAARYWKGKAPKGVADIPSDSEESDEGPAPEEEGDVPVGGDQDIVEEGDDDLPVRAETAKPARTMNVALKDVNISNDGRVTVAGRMESGRTAMEDEESEEESESEEQLPGAAKPDSDESSEDQSDSEEEEERPKLQFRPVFIPKRARVTVQEKDALAADSEEAIRQKELELEERRKQSHDLVAETIKRELAEKEKEEEVPDVDDTDGLDPAAEFEAWRLRELGRIKKEKEEEIHREEEREEIERRRALPEEQRLKEDLERAEKSRAEKPKGQQKFLQKYWHKGAFRQDDEILRKHDYTEATESTMDVSLLPKVMQVKNFGKRSRTKYTHLLGEDTTAGNGGFGGTAPVKAGGTSTAGGGCFLCGGPHLKKDCPQNTGPALHDRKLASGANSISSELRPRAHGGEKDSWRDHREPNDRPRFSDRKDDRRDRPRDYENERYDDRRGSRRYSPDRYNGDRRHRRPSPRSASPPANRWRADESRRRDSSRSRDRSLHYEEGREKRRRLD